MDIKTVLPDLIDLILATLSDKNKSLIGLDIGASSIKAAVVEFKDNIVYLQEFQTVPLPEGTILDEEILNEEALIDALKKLASLLQTKNRKVCLGLYNSSTIIKRLQLVGDIHTKDDIDAQIDFEIEQYLPFDVDDALISYNVIGDLEIGGVDLVLGATKEELINKYLEAIEKTGLRTKIVDINPLAISNIFELAYGDRISPSKSWIILDLGSHRTTFIVYSGQSISFTKEIPIGGSIITEEIQRTMGISRADAENLKVLGDASGNIPEEVVNVIKESLRKIFVEIKKTLDFYNTVTSGDVLEQVVLSGGCANIPGLVEGLSALISLPVTIIDISPVVNMDGFDEETAKYILTQGIVAIGLAMRKFKI